MTILFAAMNDHEHQLLTQLLNSGQRRGRNNFLRLTACEFVVKHGWWYSPISIPQHVARGESNECFTNAFLRAVQHPELAYVEGYATLDDGIRTAHAWLTDYLGNAIEITWDRLGSAYAGVPLKLEFLGNRLREHGEIGSMIDDYMNDWPLLRDAGERPDEWLNEKCQGREKIEVAQ